MSACVCQWMFFFFHLCQKNQLWIDIFWHKHNKVQKSKALLAHHACVHVLDFRTYRIKQLEKCRCSGVMVMVSAFVHFLFTENLLKGTSTVFYNLLTANYRKKSAELWFVYLVYLFSPFFPWFMFGFGQTRSVFSWYRSELLVVTKQNT